MIDITKLDLLLNYIKENNTENLGTIIEYNKMLTLYNEFNGENDIKLCIDKLIVDSFIKEHHVKLLSHANFYHIKPEGIQFLNNGGYLKQNLDNVYNELLIQSEKEKDNKIKNITLENIDHQNKVHKNPFKDKYLIPITKLVIGSLISAIIYYLITKYTGVKLN